MTGGREEGKSIRRRIDIAKGETDVVYVTLQRSLLPFAVQGRRSPAGVRAGAIRDSGCRKRGVQAV